MKIYVRIFKEIHFHKQLAFPLRSQNKLAQKKKKASLFKYGFLIYPNQSFPQSFSTGT